MLTSSTERFQKIQKGAPAEYQKYLVQVTKYQTAENCKIVGKWIIPREQKFAPADVHFHQFVVPPVLPIRSVCTYGDLAAMRLPPRVKGLGSLHQNSTCGAAENVETAAKPNGIMHEPVHADRPNAFTNNSSSVLSCIQTAVDIPSQSRKIDVPPNIYLESRSAMGDASILSFSSVESNTQPLNEPLMDADTTSFGFLGEMPQNFGFSDLTADFTNSSGGIERLTNASENLRYTNSSGD
ncbi:hypothetical protein T459_00007 [Capsicum annuum]|uniref:Very-long-chain aldehyde decarbonylase CER1-like C-terminal domain-containing protein n=1 Tax=Capsicum annuum TaxID=4072 RepID=A0A2G3AD23_CAPAN|nr:hypothetical protein T459_00007 [Capsicum annuum]